VALSGWREDEPYTAQIGRESFEDLLGPSSNMFLFGLGVGLSVPVTLTPSRPEDVSGLTLGGMRTERLAVKPPARKG